MKNIFFIFFLLVKGDGSDGSYYALMECGCDEIKYVTFSVFVLQSREIAYMMPLSSIWIIHMKKAIEWICQNMVIKKKKKYLSWVTCKMYIANCFK